MLNRAESYKVEEKRRLSSKALTNHWKLRSDGEEAASRLTLEPKEAAVAFKKAKAIELTSFCFSWAFLLTRENKVKDETIGLNHIFTARLQLMEKQLFFQISTFALLFHWFIAADGNSFIASTLTICSLWMK